MNKNFKFGFTLAEALMAMAIAGVIASLVVPSLVAGTQNRKHATSLGRSVEAIESGCQLLIQDASEKSTDGEFFGHIMINKTLDGHDIGTLNGDNVNTKSVVGQSKLFENAGSYFNATPVPSNNKTQYAKSVKNFDGGVPNPKFESIVTNMAYSEKLGAYYGVKFTKHEGKISDHIADPLVELIYIDVNGANSPNRYGIDIFLFGLTDACHMIPAGTTRMKDFVKMMGATIPEEAKGCPKSGLACTARVVKDGYKINYKK